ncbi:MAG TPA: TonB-dependent receptor [Pyrinomonadaceae bacterium]|jgi:hypothetical protein
MVLLVCVVAQSVIIAQTTVAQTTSRTLSGVILSQQNELVPGVSIIVRSSVGEQRGLSDPEGRFTFPIPNEPITVRFEAQNLKTLESSFSREDRTTDLQIRVTYVIPPIHESVVIEATSLDPTIDRRNDTIYKNTLFNRDDQLFHTLNAGINAGQHEGGGKSLEVRRFGFNLDHGGVNGGLKILVDDVQQNQGTQGHGQGYLGQLKSLTPELVKDVAILNGPFSAQYGDFSGLGVVHIRLRESLPDQLTLRFQGGSFNAYRNFLAYSPQIKDVDSFVAYEMSRTDGPFISPLNYKRDNLTGNFTWHAGPDHTLGFKLNLGRHDFFSSGQIPLDKVATGELDRFGFIDPTNGGKARTLVGAIYYQKTWVDGSSFKADGFVMRSLFDLFSNFTFFLTDPVNGDGIQQHDSRLQEGANAQYLRPFKLGENQALFTAGASLLFSQINVGLSTRLDRVPREVVTKAQVRLANPGWYLQQGIDLWQGRLHVEGGLRFDFFRFAVDDVIDTINEPVTGADGEGKFQPKLSISFRPTDRIPASLYFNYGRGINSQDARGVIQRPDSPKLATTDFYQLGLATNLMRFSLSSDLFLIDHSNEQVYIPDDGSFEFKGASRSYGYEVKSSVRVSSFLTFNAGITQVMNSFFRGTAPREYVDSSPHTVADGGVTLDSYRGFTASLRYRHTGNYRLDPFDASIRASGLDVIDFAVAKRIRPWLDLDLSIDNLTNKRYFETQNYFASRLRNEPLEGANRIHGTPGYPFGVTAGITFRLFNKE